jgi:hypothetical protein
MTNDVSAFCNNRYFIIYFYDLYTKTNPIVAENRSIILAALILIYMIMFGHGLPKSINRNLF